MNDWKLRLERWLTPLAQRSIVSPDQITFAALLLCLAAAGCLGFSPSRPTLLPLASILLTAGGVLDGLDGLVARIQGKTSTWGDFLDHLFDRISDLTVLAGWCLAAGVRTPLAFAVLILVMLNGYIGTQIEATWKQRSYNETGRGEFIIGLVAYPLIAFFLGDLLHVKAILTIGEWMTVLAALTALIGIVQRLKLARKLAAAETVG